MANTNTKKPEDEVVPGLPDMSTINKEAVDTASANLSAARGMLNNMSYDTFKQGTLYDGLKKSYEQQGKKAMQDTLGQVAARTGGMASSYATSAANQSYNNYMQTLEDTARAMYNDEYSKARDKVDLAQQGYNNAYGEYRDNVGDAWTRYNAENDAYWKNKNYNYQVGRDAIEDKRYEDSQKATDKQNYLDSIIEMAAAGINPEFDQTKADEFGITIEDFNNAVSIGTNQYKNSAGYLSNQAATDERLGQIFGAEGFDWDSFDWDQDGKVGKDDDKEGTAAEYFKNMGSAYGADYWEQFYKDAQQGYADADTKEAQEEVMAILEAGGEPPIDLLIKAGWLEEITPVNEGETPDYDGDDNGIPDGLSGLAATMWQNNIDSKTAADTKEAQDSAVDDINARIANGESLEDIAADYGIGATTADGNGEAATWESVTGMSKAEWQQIYNDNKIGNYTYQKNAEGRTNIVNALVDSATMRLSDKDIENFDYIYGEGAYDIVQDFADTLDEALNQAYLTWLYGNQTASGRDNDIFNKTLTSLMEELSAVVPGLKREQIVQIVEKKAPAFMDLVDDPESAANLTGKVYIDGQWVMSNGGK